MNLSYKPGKLYVRICDGKPTLLFYGTTNTEGHMVRAHIIAKHSQGATTAAEQTVWFLGKTVVNSMGQTISYREATDEDLKLFSETWVSQLKSFTKERWRIKMLDLPHLVNQEKDRINEFFGID